MDEPVIGPLLAHSKGTLHNIDATQVTSALTQRGTYGPVPPPCSNTQVVVVVVVTLGRINPDGYGKPTLSKTEEQERRTASRG